MTSPHPPPSDGRLLFKLGVSPALALITLASLTFQLCFPPPRGRKIQSVCPANGCQGTWLVGPLTAFSSVFMLQMLLNKQRAALVIRKAVMLSGASVNERGDEVKRGRRGVHPTGFTL